MELVEPLLKLVIDSVGGCCGPAFLADARALSTINTLSFDQFLFQFDDPCSKGFLTDGSHCWLCRSRFRSHTQQQFVRFVSLLLYKRSH